MLTTRFRESDQISPYVGTNAASNISPSFVTSRATYPR
jgi:hypothetical protein